MSSERRAVTKLYFREAIARAVCEEMEGDESIIVLGQDVGPMGGSYKEFLGLFDAFGPARVRDMPVAEASMVGIGIGVAAAGMRSLVNITYMDFITLGLDPLVNYAAKLRYKTGGQLHAPVTIKTTAGARGQGVAHSQCLEAWLMAVPGLKLVAPSNPADAYGLMKSALREGGPVVYVDHKRLFPTAGEVPLERECVPIGRAARLREGTDVTIATHSFMTRIALEAAERLARERISCDIVDLRSLAPLDMDFICGSVGKTGALVTLEEGQIACGVGTEVAQRVRERIGDFKSARIGALAAPVSSNPVLEAACLPDAERVTASVRRLLGA